MATPVEFRERIVDTALALAQTCSWEAVRLHEVAAALGVTLDDIRSCFREKEELVDAWLDRADRAMLEDAARPEFKALPPRQRLHRSIMTWLATLAPHRKIACEMVQGKLEPGHLHVQLPALLRVSRTVQWFREAADRDATFVHRAFEEAGLTTIYLITFTYWLRDDSECSAATAALLERLLAAAERLSHQVFGPTSAARSESVEPD